MYRIDPLRVDLAAAFKARPFGPHTAELMALVTSLRMAPIEGKHVLLAAADGRSWELAQLTGQRHEAPRRLGVHFGDLAEAEWAVFRLRWEAATSERLELA